MTGHTAAGRVCTMKGCAAPAVSDIAALNRAACITRALLLRPAQTRTFGFVWLMCSSSRFLLTAL